MNGGWMESLNFTSYRNACAALPSAARWKAARFHAPSKPLTRHEKIWHQSWQKHKGEMNDTIVDSKTSIMLNTLEKQYIFVCISEVTNNTCDWLNIVNSHYSKTWSKSELNCGPVARQLSSLDMVVSFSFIAWQERSERSLEKLA